MTKIYEIFNGKAIRLSSSQFDNLAESIYQATEKGKFNAVITLNDNPEDSLVCYSKQGNFACQRRVILNENAVNYNLPTVLFSSAFYPTKHSFINMLWCIGDCTIEVYDSDGMICKKVFNLRGV